MTSGERFSVNIRREDLKRLDEMAKKREISKNAYVNLAIKILNEIDEAGDRAGEVLWSHLVARVVDSDQSKEALVKIHDELITAYNEKRDVNNPKKSTPHHDGGDDGR